MKNAFKHHSTWVLSNSHTHFWSEVRLIDLMGVIGTVGKPISVFYEFQVFGCHWKNNMKLLLSANFKHHKEKTQEDKKQEI